MLIDALPSCCCGHSLALHNAPSPDAYGAQDRIDASKAAGRDITPRRVSGHARRAGRPLQPVFPTEPETSQQAFSTTTIRTPPSPCCCLGPSLRKHRREIRSPAERSEDNTPIRDLKSNHFPSFWTVGRIYSIRLWYCGSVQYCSRATADHPASTCRRHIPHSRRTDLNPVVPTLPS